MSVVEQSPSKSGRRTRDAIVDCDVHNLPRSDAEVKRYIPPRWRDYYDREPPFAADVGLVLGARPQNHIFRRDSVPTGGPPGSDLGLMREQLLDRFNVHRALLITLESPKLQQYGEAGLALAAGVNDWNAEEWLDADDRLFGTMTVPSEDAERAAAEIERVAQHGRFVAVNLPMHTREPMGHPKYWPMYEAAAASRLPLIVHVNGFAGFISALHPPTYFVERHTGMTHPYQVQIVSLVYSGIFDRFPSLRFVLAEGGLSWAASLMWRLDRIWQGMRKHEPHLTVAPSQVIREHFAFTTQPLDEPAKPEHLAQVLEHIGMDDRVLFASDYPHWDFDDPNRVLPSATVGGELRERILSQNAENLFPFPA
jgi:predicted TIM-barrel fold metal-dependent hydrolase